MKFESEEQHTYSNGTYRATPNPGLLDTFKPLLTDLLSTAVELLRKEAALARAEIREDFENVLVALRTSLTTLVFSFCTVLMLLMTGVFGIQAAFPQLPLWGAFGIVAVITGVISALMALRMKQAFKQLSIPPQKTLQSIKESVQCITRM